jgi:hypothetical protein
VGGQLAQIGLQILLVAAPEEPATIHRNLTVRREKLSDFSILWVSGESAPQGVAMFHTLTLYHQLHGADQCTASAKAMIAYAKGEIGHARDCVSGGPENGVSGRIS